MWSSTERADGRLGSVEMEHVKNTSFDVLIQKSELPVFVDFWAEWCAPCHAVGPAVKELARAMKGKLIVVKVNVDKQPRLAHKFAVQGIPTLMLFKNGKIIWRTTGALSFAALKAAVETHVR